MSSDPFSLINLMSSDPFSLTLFETAAFPVITTRNSLVARYNSPDARSKANAGISKAWSTAKRLENRPHDLHCLCDRGRCMPVGRRFVDMANPSLSRDSRPLRGPQCIWLRAYSHPRIDSAFRGMANFEAN